jgi:hypothetical protein
MISPWCLLDEISLLGLFLPQNLAKKLISYAQHHVIEGKISGLIRVFVGLAFVECSFVDSFP